MMQLLLLLVFSVFSTFGNSTTLHELHLSKCVIKHNTKTSSLQVTLHIFIDDLELSLKQAGIENLYILTEKEAENANFYIENYITERLSITVDDKPVQFKYLGKEISEDMMVAWCYLEVNDITDIRTLQITNKILIELYDDQKNIVTVKKNRDRKAYFLFDTENVTDSVEM